MVNERQKPHFTYIECTRGYAILLVMLCHTAYSFPELPYLVHRVAVLGWHGVQLFFLASTITLMMSWNHEKFRTGAVDIGAFFIRRFFRIAPAYYLASVLYFVLEPPGSGFDPMQAAATCLFINTWHPVLVGATPNAWTVVPGGWSIGVEFTFYAIFPLVASNITSLQRAIYLFLGTLLAGAITNTLFWPTLLTSFGSTAADNFLYFWFPNQMSVFALGMCVFFLLRQEPRRVTFLISHPALVAAFSIGLVAITAFVTLPHWLSLQMSGPPTFILVSLALTVFILALGRARPGIFVNRPMALMGRVSFSAYLIHFAVLKGLAVQPFLQSYLTSAGWPAILWFALTFTGVVLVVLGVSWCTYRLIEMPMIQLGKALIRLRRPQLAQSLS